MGLIWKYGLNGRLGCEVKTDRWDQLEREQPKGFNLLLVGVLQLDLSFRKIVLAEIRWEIVMSELTAMKV